jgi:hypothetical protein
MFISEKIKIYKRIRVRFPQEVNYKSILKEFKTVGVNAGVVATIGHQR